MRIEAPTSLLPFSPGERPGVAKGTLDKKLKGLDLSGVVYRQAKPRDSMPATSVPVNDIKGLLPINAAPAQTQEARLEAQARQLVSQTFFGTMLKQMRDSPFKSDLFEGGRGGAAFSSMYDQKLVEQMSRGAGKKLVDSVVSKFTKAKKAYATQAKGGQAETPVPGRPYDAVNAGRPTGIETDTGAKEATNPYRNVKINVHPALRS
ncbi:rod-binding protein [Humisphaera borealis]|uniref:Rod-binding protein n=1 Tax=Humisphaera borealis TaxID=2807512 RepID=A0A7M2X1H9_9BACT|nr:rod-binding protein [Humisphaera borealis]QOV91524.1 rod-binding protein [Humisphaera borealis]